MIKKMLKINLSFGRDMGDGRRGLRGSKGDEGGGERERGSCYPDDWDRDFSALVGRLQAQTNCIDHGFSSAY